MSAFLGRCAVCSLATNAPPPRSEGGVKNGELIRLAEGEFDLFITSDQG
jgi:hypothetical protein